jgi:GT2 family glycosyltransferase
VRYHQTMISIIVSFRNNGESARNVLRTLLRATNLLGIDGLEFILIDDNSAPAHNIPKLMTEFRSQLSADAKVTELHFTEHQNYTRALAYGLSAAKGAYSIFISHDMLVTSEYVRTLLAVATSNSSIGVVRGTSPNVHGFPQHCIVPPFPIYTFEQVDAFANYVGTYFGLKWVEDRLLIGDSMLIKREVLDKIGVFDPRYIGFFGDFDFGLRVQRAGFKMVCAKGAWLWHEGAGAYKNSPGKETHVEIDQGIKTAYQAFRQKWDFSLPAEYPGIDSIPFESMRHIPAPADGEYQMPITPRSEICQIR